MENAYGGWVINPAVNTETQEMSDVQIAIFEQAVGQKLGVGYTPLLYIGSQLVAGHKHAYIAECRAITANPQNKSVVKVVIFESLEHECTVESISEIS